MVSSILKQTGLDAGFLEFEIAESMLMDDIEQAIDDFVTGYTSLSYLTRLPVDKHKVDRTFVSTLPESVRYSAIATAIIAMAQRVRMQVSAEGVETHSQASFLTEHQCFSIQDYPHGSSVSAADLPVLLRVIDQGF